MFLRRNKYIFSYEKKRQAALIKRVLTVIFVILAVLIILFAAIALYNSKIHIDLTNERTVPVNTEAVASQFIEGIGNGRLVEDAPIDSSSVGPKDVTVKIKVGDEIRDYTFTVDIIDTQAPAIKIAENQWTVLMGTPLDLPAKAEVSDNSGESITATQEGEYNPNALGTQTVKLVAQDSSGNTTEQNITIDVIEIKANMPDMKFLTTTGHQAEIKEGLLYVDNILVVNKTFGLPESYGSDVTPETMDAYYKMINDAWQQGIFMEIVMGYRSYREQAQLFEYWSEVAKEGENTMSAVKAGHSEHQSGLALDINSTQMSFVGTAAEEWLKANCQKYGFILRYPEDKVAVTGCAWEPWHIRYVGKDLAEKLYNDGKWITLEEYFGIPSEYMK